MTETVISDNLAFTDLGLAPELLRALTESGYTKPTPIQAQAIPVSLAGGDLMAGAQTGTGKTAAFALPLLQKLLPLANSSTSPAKHPVRALILTPTRELAIQVEESVKTYAKHTQLRSLVVFGGVDIKTQTPHLKTGVEVLVATPGRLLDHIEQKTLQLNQVQILVLDEADRMLDMGFMPDLKRILALLPKQRQNLMFSATFSNEIKKLADEFLTKPQLIEVARSNATNDNVTQKVYEVAQSDKEALLTQLLKEADASQVIIFTKTKITASRLSRSLAREGIAADAIHGDKSQQERIKALDAFKAGTISALVATDVAARGLDISELPMVINYEIPSAPEDYVHRIGRTGRAGALGIAISFVSPEENKYIVEIEKLIKRQIPKETVTLEKTSTRTRASSPKESSYKTNSTQDASATKRAPAKKKSSDPWFDKPYEASTSAKNTVATTKQIISSKAPVAALLGGLRTNK
ncbi:MAG: DEAD/DEAH box helicase [Methylotenera sp.]|uniref:DEAD/DEAH box helicase n=1 Tax=Methylotenera sp. TaxID=2051956 RepID=UPI00181568F5|nr:DEAD/DEAH box helicase [Methylotenera sp.]NOU25988.1 DEAD/DEAH box helicase [Methylotenera sp.]